MLKKLASILFSTRLTATLFIIYALAMAVGTFMDQGQSTSPTPYSRTLIYNAWWFEAIMVVFMVNFVGNIFKYRLLRKEKWATLTLHLSFISILLGAFITRYYGFEGMMSIREGATENTFLSQKTYLTTYIDGDYQVNGQLLRRSKSDAVDFSPRLENDYILETTYGNSPVIVELIDFISGAEEDIVPDENGDFYLKLVEAGSGAPHNHFLKLGQVSNIHNVLYALNKPTSGAINLTYSEGGGLTIQSPFEGEFMTMASGQQGRLVKDSVQPLALRSRYLIGNQAVVFPKPVVKGVFDVVKKSELLKGDEDGIALKVTARGETKIVKLLGGQGVNNPFKQIKVGGLDFAFKYGSKVLELPFDIKLNDFIAERYPGTENSYASFESKVTVFDAVEGEFDFHIYMNNILKHRGYRFFQSSFDPDEKGTVLSVNHDYWGTWFTYLGYYLLYFGLLAILLSKGARMEFLRKQLDKIKRKKANLTVFLSLISLGLSAQINHNTNHKFQRPSQQQLDSILAQNITPATVSDCFGYLVIQDADGRMKPVNTYASELLRKLSKKDHYQNYTADQVFLSMQESPQLWYNVPIIYLKLKKADTIRSIIGIPKDQKYAALVDFLDINLNYKLGPYLEDAYSAQVPTAIQKELKTADQRVSLLFNTLDGDVLRLFPIPDDLNSKWVSPREFIQKDLVLKDSLYANFIRTGFLAYMATLQNEKVQKKEEFSQSDKLLDAIKKTQIKYGGEAMLSDKKINAEITYNKYDIFKKLFSWYMYASSLMFVLLIVQILRDKSKILNISINVFKALLFFCFALHTAGLIARWYISGHAPWSDAYESMIYVAWATMAFGVMLGYKSNLTFASTAFVTAMILMIAHWNWMDPSIGNLQPVLNSYWLMIHVAVIVGSYGPFALGMILGLISLLLMQLTNAKNKEKMALNVKELTVINEMALTVGLVMLTIGNFLGGMWANESWGRYWGWDPKETWALISIMIYAFVIHMRLVPGLRNRLVFNIASVLAFGSILMTYFGVNFYLAGLHSYAKDDQEISINYILTALAIISTLSFLAYLKYRKFYTKSN